MLISSEYVTLGHPDRLCDTIAANLINRIQKKDGVNSHAAVEVFASNDTVVFGGEVKTSLKINKKLLKEILKESFIDCGYIPERRNLFTKDEVYLATDTKIINKIHAQSPDIAIATTDKKNKTGFNDQGIFFGSYDSLTPNGQGVAKYLAQSFGDYLFNKSKENICLGSDIKIVFTINVDDKDMYTPKSIEHVTVAIPNKNITNIDAFVNNQYKYWVINITKNLEIKNKYSRLHKMLCNSFPDIKVNGTGRYVNHGYHSDASMTGRKLAVNNMSAGPVYSQCQCGGGSYIKPFHASDFLLPMAGNMIAKAIVDSGYSDYANVALACTIGSTHVDSICITGDTKFNKNKKLINNITDYFKKANLSPECLAKNWGYPNSFDFYSIAKSNFVGDSCPWMKLDLSSNLREHIETLEAVDKIDKKE